MEPLAVSRYQLKGVLGIGPLGKVYEAIKIADGSRWALRGFARPEDVDGERWEAALERLARELEPALGLRHPNIGAVYEFWVENGVHVIRSEYFTGENLRQMMDGRARTEVRRALEIVTSVAHALEYAHEKGVVHSDLTPYNVVCTAEGVKVINFGLGHARPKDDSPYRAPEQVLGHEADARSDLFALGVLLYEMLSGRNPFAGKDAEAIGEAILRRAVPPVGEVEFWLMGVVARLLAKSPERRYQSVRELLQDLETSERQLGVKHAEGTEFPVSLSVAEPAPSLADFPQLRRSDLKSYGRRFGHRRTARIVCVGTRWLWLRRAALVGVLALGLAWDYGRQGPTWRVMSAVGLGGGLARDARLVDFVPQTELEAHAQSCLETIAVNLARLRAEGTYPVSLGLETLDELGLPPDSARSLLEPFDEDRLSRYERTRAGFRITAHLDDQQRTCLLMEQGKIWRVAQQ